MSYNIDQYISKLKEQQSNTNQLSPEVEQLLRDYFKKYDTLLAELNTFKKMDKNTINNDFRSDSKYKEQIKNLENQNMLLQRNIDNYQIKYEMEKTLSTQQLNELRRLKCKLNTCVEEKKKIFSILQNTELEKEAIQQYNIELQKRIDHQSEVLGDYKNKIDEMEKETVKMTHKNGIIMNQMNEQYKSCQERLERMIYVYNLLCTHDNPFDSLYRNKNQQMTHVASYKSIRNTISVDSLDTINCAPQQNDQIISRNKSYSIEGPIRNISSSSNNLIYCSPNRLSDCISKGHLSEVTGLMFTHDSSELISTGKDGWIHVWDTSTKKEKESLNINIPVVCLDVYKDIIAAGLVTGTLFIWNRKTNTKKFLHVHKGLVTCIRLYNCTVFSSSLDRTIKQTDIYMSTCIQSISINSICYSFDIYDETTTLISAHIDHHIHLWNIQNGQITNTYTNIHFKPITCVFINSEELFGYKLVTTSKDNSLKLIDLEDPDVIISYTNQHYQNTNEFTKCCLSPHNTYILGCSETNKVVIWNVYTGKTEQIFDYHHSPVHTCAWSKNSQIIATGDTNGLIIISAE
ncbi:hypothetical protein WA158_000953 [Blastocystis sp. Blastoise]